MVCRFPICRPNPTVNLFGEANCLVVCVCVCGGGGGGGQYKIDVPIQFDNVLVLAFCLTSR